MTTSLRNAIPLNVRFKVKQLALMVVLNETRSLRQAATQIFVSQPAATRLLHELEAALGVELFDRTRRGMHPTPAGDVMIRHAQFLLNGMANACNEAIETAAGNAGMVRLGVFGAIDPEFLSSSLIELHLRFPRLRVIVKEAPNEMLLEALRNADLDVIVGRVNAPQSSQLVDHEVLYLQEFSLVVGPKSPLKRKRNINLRDLLHTTWILPPRETLLRQNIDTLFLTQAGKMPESYIESTSFFSNVALVRKSSMVGIMPKQIAAVFASQQQVAILPVNLPGISRPVAMMTLKNQVLSPATVQVMALLRQCAHGTAALG